MSRVPLNTPESCFLFSVLLCREKCFQFQVRPLQEASSGVREGSYQAQKDGPARYARQGCVLCFLMELKILSFSRVFLSSKFGNYLDLC